MAIGLSEVQFGLLSLRVILNNKKSYYQFIIKLTIFEKRNETKESRPTKHTSLGTTQVLCLLFAAILKERAGKFCL